MKLCTEHKQELATVPLEGEGVLLLETDGSLGYLRSNQGLVYFQQKKQRRRIQILSIHQVETVDRNERPARTCPRILSRFSIDTQHLLRKGYWPWPNNKPNNKLTLNNNECSIRLYISCTNTLLACHTVSTSTWTAVMHALITIQAAAG